MGKARRLLNVKTDTEAIQKALQKAIVDREIEESLDKLLKGRSLPDHLQMKYLLDTNVYLEAFRSEERKSQFRQTFFLLPPATFSGLGGRLRT